MANYVPVDYSPWNSGQGFAERDCAIFASVVGDSRNSSPLPLYKKIPPSVPSFSLPFSLHAPSTISTARRRHLWPDRTRTPPRPVLGARLCALPASLSSSSSSVPRRFDSGSRSVGQANRRRVSAAAKNKIILRSRSKPSCLPKRSRGTRVVYRHHPTMASTVGDDGDAIGSGGGGHHRGGAGLGGGGYHRPPPLSPLDANRRRGGGGGGGHGYHGHGLPGLYGGGGLFGGGGGAKGLGIDLGLSPASLEGRHPNPIASVPAAALPAAAGPSYSYDAPVDPRRDGHSDADADAEGGGWTFFHGDLEAGGGAGGGIGLDLSPSQTEQPPMNNV